MNVIDINITPAVDSEDVLVNNISVKPPFEVPFAIFAKKVILDNASNNIIDVHFKNIPSEDSVIYIHGVDKTGATVAFGKAAPASGDVVVYSASKSVPVGQTDTVSIIAYYKV